MIKLSPSILAADPLRLGQAAEMALNAGCDELHFDVMDGHFVPNLTFGPHILKAMKQELPGIVYDVHLMLDNPAAFVDPFCDAGADWVTFHPEASEDVRGALNEIKSKGVKCGLVVNADQPFSIVEPYLDEIDMLLVMTVQAGFGGQSFKEDCLEKVRMGEKLRVERGLNYDIEIDGGVSPSNIERCKEAGATIVVAGSSVFKAEDPTAAVKAMQI